MSLRGAAVALALSVAPSLVGADPLALTENTAGAALAPHCELLRDPRGSLDARAVLAHRDAVPVRGDGVDIGFTADTVWLRCRVRNSGRARGEWLVDVGGQLDRVDVITERDGALRVERGGRLRPRVDVEVSYTSFVSRALVDGDTEAPVLIRVRSDAPVVLRPRVWSAHTFVDHALREVFVMGLFYGLLLVVLAYNLSLYASTRQRIYRLYTAFVGSLLLFALVVDQLVVTFVTPRDAAWQATSGVRFGTLAALAAIAFTRAYLDTPKMLPRADRAARPFEAVLVALFASTFASNSVVFKKAAMAVSAPALVALFVAAIVCWRRGSREAPWFLLGWTVSTGGFLVRGAVQVGAVPMSTVTENAWRAGLVFNVALLSLGLAARVRALRDEKERAQSDLLAGREAMTARLESLVAVRTRELEAAMRDLTEAQRAIAHQKRAASLGQLAAALAHEVANPLNFTAGGAAELARRVEALKVALEGLDARHPDDPDLGRARIALAGARKSLELVQGGNARIRSVVDSLRAYMRSGAVEPEAVDVMEAVRSTLRLMESKLAAQRVEVTVTGDDLPRVRGRTGELCQVFMNLMLNAAQAMPDGGTIAVTGVASGSRVEVVIADTGPGIPPERRSAVFDPFFTTRGDEGGTGLGLSISHEIVRRLGGELSLAESETGATFVVRLQAWEEA